MAGTASDAVPSLFRTHRGDWSKGAVKQQPTGEVALDADRLRTAIEEQIRKKKSDDKFFRNVESVDVKLDEARFKRIVALSQREEAYYPVLTYHGTWSVDAANSIVRHGYLFPGERHPVLGTLNYVATGSWFGVGVYTSIEKEFAKWYAFQDANQDVFMVVNLVFLGDVEFLESAKMRYEGEVLPNDDGKYCEGKYDTRAVDGLRQVVSGCAQRVVPVGIVHFKTEETRRISFSRAGCYAEPEKILRVRCLSRNYYICFPEFAPDPCQAELVHHYCCSNAFLKQSEAHFQTLVELMNRNRSPGRAGSPQMLYVSGGKNTTTVSCNGGEHLRRKRGEAVDLSCCSNNPYNVLSSVARAMHAIYEMQLEGKKKARHLVHVVYIIFDKTLPTDAEKMKKLLDQYLVVQNVGSVHVKFLLQTEQELTSSDNVFMLKSFDNVLLSWEDYFSYVSREDGDYLNVLIDQTARLQHCFVSYAVLHEHRLFGEGFLTDLTAPPSWEAKAEATCLLLKDSQSLRLLQADGNLVRLKDETSEWPDRDLKHLFDVLSRLLSKLRLAVMYDKSNYAKYTPVLRLFCDRVWKFISDQKGSLPVLKSLHYLLSKYVSDFKVAGVPFTGTLFENFQGLKYSKGLLRRTKLLKEAKKAKGEEEEKPSPEELLSGMELLGLGLTVVLSDSSKVEPWNLIVTHVSKEEFDFKEVYRSNEFQVKMRDRSGKRVNAVLPLGRALFESAEAEQAFLAYLYTRNPFLHIPSQRLALYTNSFVFLLEDIIVKCRIGKATRDDVAAQLRVAHALLERVQVKRGLVEDLLLRPEGLEASLTETCGIVSTNTVLALLKAPENCRVIDEKIGGKRFAFALLAEAVARSCRAYCKIHRKDKASIYEELMDRKQGTGSVVNMKRALAVSSRFFKMRWTASSPYSIISALGFFARYHGGVDMEALTELYHNRTISMSSFLAQYYSKEDGPAVQVALFLQGVRFAKAAQRQRLEVFDAEKIMKTCAADHTEMIRAEEALEMRRAALQGRREKRIFERKCRLLAEQREALEAHKGLPRQFTRAEVNEMNLNRHVDSKFQLCERTGLLTNYCCYEGCDLYLKQRMTRTDLFRHLTYYKKYLMDDYKQGYHLEAERIFNENRHSAALLSKKIGEHCSAYGGAEQLVAYLKKAYP